MESLIQSLGLGPWAGLLILLTSMTGLVAWKLAKIDSRISYLMKLGEENQREHEKMWQEMHDLEEATSTLREHVSKILGKIEK